MTNLKLNGPSLREVRDLALDLMQRHGLHDWRFRFDMARARYGFCSNHKRVISISMHLAMMNPIRKTRVTILHEIAHALTPGHNHDAVWRAKAIEIGSDGKRCYGSDVRAPGANLYVAACPNCQRIVSEIRLRKPGARACGVCCRNHNGGQFSAEFLLEWRQAETGDWA